MQGPNKKGHKGTISSEDSTMGKQIIVANVYKFRGLKKDGCKGVSYLENS